MEENEWLEGELQNRDAVLDELNRKLERLQVKKNATQRSVERLEDQIVQLK